MSHDVVRRTAYCGRHAVTCMPLSLRNAITTTQLVHDSDLSPSLPGHRLVLQIASTEP